MTHRTIVRGSVAATAALSVLVYATYHYPRDLPTGFDDAYMALRYARHWIAGGGFSWNVSDGPAYGITSPMYLFIVTALRATTNLSDHVLLSALSYVAGLGAVATLVVVGFVLFPQLRRAWLPLLVIPAIVLSGPFAFHSLTGMETTLALLANALLAAAALALARRPSPARLTACLLAACASLLTRPDMGMYCLLLPPLLLLAEQRRVWRWGIVYAVGFALLVAMHLLINPQLFGSYLPLPMLAKSAGFYRGFLGIDRWNPGAMLFVFLHASLPFLLVWICCTTRRTLPRLAAFLLPMALTFGYYGTVTQIMGHEARYYYPSLSLLIVGCYIAAEAAIEHSAALLRPATLAWVPRLGMAMMAVAVLNSPLIQQATTSAWRRLFIAEPERFTARDYPARRDARQLPERDWWQVIHEVDVLLGALPRDTVVAASEYGYLGARHPDLTVVDLVGLHDREVATNGFTIDYLLSRQPDLIWLPPTGYTHLRQQILNSEAFAKAYDYYPYAYVYGMAVRRGSTSADEEQDALTQGFARLYPGEMLSDYKAE